MDQPTSTKLTSHKVFARYYELFSRGLSESSFMDPLRRESVGQAKGVVLEIGVGTGLNLPYYKPEQVERVEAIEPDEVMLRYARERLKMARVPVTLTRAAVESLPFANGSFDSVVATLVFCSVSNPQRGFQEVMRVLKPGGTLLLVEHVRSGQAFLARVQDAIVPLTKLLSGNCHWNRDTARTVVDTGFHITFERKIHSLLMPMIMLQATSS